eukprot:jgi/Chrzof1/11429/Cz05g36120.t1
MAQVCICALRSADSEFECFEITVTDGLSPLSSGALVDLIIVQTAASHPQDTTHRYGYGNIWISDSVDMFMNTVVAKLLLQYSKSVHNVHQAAKLRTIRMQGVSKPQLR